MVTGTTDNGGCKLLEHVCKDGPAIGWAQSIAAYAPPAAARWRIGDLRKTARGASSPAKPALHIPELSIVSAVHQVCVAPAGLSQGCGGSSKSWVMPMPTAPPRQGWLKLDIGGYELTHCR